MLLFKFLKTRTTFWNMFSFFHHKLQPCISDNLFLFRLLVNSSALSTIVHRMKLAHIIKILSTNYLAHFTHYMSWSILLFDDIILILILTLKTCWKLVFLGKSNTPVWTLTAGKMILPLWKTVIRNINYT